ncbi:competence protein ComEC [Brevundimonas sp. Leaf363]|nr:competence protein ComEC [Brevundimonas sp. Leaf363]
MPTRRARVAGWLGEMVARQTDRWRLWAPVAFGAGCASYFAVKTEPPLWPLLLLALVATGAWGVARLMHARRGVTLALMLVACAALGLAAAKGRTMRVAAPIAPSSDGPVRIEGWVVDVDPPGERGMRVVIAPVRIEGLAPEATPLRLRATVRGEAPAPGTPIRLFAILNPPPGPASPGGYDFARGAFFEGMGGTAFALSDTREADLAPPPWGLRLMMAVNATRFDLARRIVERLGSRSGGVAAAMTTGHEAWIGAEDEQAMRDSGLAHILSISGLHMAIVGGFVFFLVRLGVAAWPWLALRAPGKKIAATAGLVAVGVYLIVSGAPPPAERAAITAAIAFVAVLLDREAISMHALAVAAFVVLALQPEAVVTPGFQMSFAATAALIALVEAWPKTPREIHAPWPIVAVQRLGRWIGAACLASLVAGLATGPFAMQHFNRTAVYGLFANLATSPVADFIMLPALALGAFLGPDGLGAPFMAVAGWGVDAMLAIGHWVANLPGAVRTVPSAPAAALPLAFVGVLFVCLWRGPLRWLGAPFAAAVLLWPRPPMPDVWINEAGTAAAYRDDRTAVVVRPGVQTFGVESWSRRRGLEPVDVDPAGWSCSRYACAPVDGGAPVALSWGKRALGDEALSALCASAPVVSVRAVAARLPPTCDGRLVLDGRDRGRGSVELWRVDDGWRARWSADVRGDRPWTRGS